MFVSLDKLASTPDIRPANHQATKPGPGKKGLFEKFKDGPVKTLTDKVNGPATRSQTQKKHVFHFKNLDRVVCYTKDQIPIHGTVRWTGEGFSDTVKLNVVGIETVRYLVMRVQCHL